MCAQNPGAFAASPSTPTINALLPQPGVTTPGVPQLHDIVKAQGQAESAVAATTAASIESTTDGNHKVMQVFQSCATALTAQCS